MKTTKIVLIYCLWIFTFFSCASSVKIRVQKPAEYDLQGAKTISVLPFATSGVFWGQGKDKIAKYISYSIQNELIESGFFSVIDSKSVYSALKNNQPVPCDVYIKGEVFTYFDDIRTSVVEDAENKQIEFVRHVSFLVSYSVINGKTQEIIGADQERFSFTSSKEAEIRDLPSALSLAQWELDFFVSNFLKKLEPYTETRKVFLLKDKTKNLDMEQASEFVKEGMLSNALEKYLKVYNELGLFEAGYNAARIMEAQGNYIEAEKLMLEIYNKTGEKKAKTAIKEIQREIIDAQILKEQLEKRKINFQEPPLFEK